jgi:hypothetical protein
MALGSTQPLVKMSTRNIPGGKGGRCVRLTSPISRAKCHEIWEPKPPGTLWATPGLLRDSFTFFTSIYYSNWSCPKTIISIRGSSNTQSCGIYHMKPEIQFIHHRPCCISIANTSYRISRPIKRTFFPEKCYLNSTCVLCAEGK